jgi:hypothetical protein
MRPDTKAAKGMAVVLAAAVCAVEVVRDSTLPEHSPHADPARPDPARQAVAGGGSVEGRPLRWHNALGESIQWVNGSGELVTFVANGRPSDLDGLQLHAVTESADDGDRNVPRVVRRRAGGKMIGVLEGLHQSGRSIRIPSEVPGF